MARFSEKPKLKDSDREDILKHIKPLLKENKIEEARKFARDELSNRVCEFLLFCLGEDAYFKNSDTVFDGEFFNCRFLLDIKIPDGIKYIDEWAFADCSNLRHVFVPDSTISIGSNAFNCRGLTAISIPKSCKLDKRAVVNRDKPVKVIYR